MLLFAALLLIPAGALSWNDALVWLLAYAVVIWIGSIYLLKKNPEAIEARMRAGTEKQPLQDKLAITDPNSEAVRKTRWRFLIAWRPPSRIRCCAKNYGPDIGRLASD